ncbi:MAG: M24 family metallopeptidase, partial [Nitrospirota bacterium]
HGVGLMVHEGPSLSALSKGVVDAGMVFTVEPGIYIAGWGGIRIEDMVLVTAGGHRVMTSLPREL